MRIGIIGSMQMTERMYETAEELKKRGHDAFVVSIFAASFVGKDDEEKERIKITQKNNEDAIRKDLKIIENTDAVLALNLDKNGIPNYIGGNTFLEIGYAHFLDKKVYLYNPIPEIPFYRTELVAIDPINLNGDLSRVV